MQSRTLIRYLGTTAVLGAMLMPLSSQADVYWSLRLGQPLQPHHSQARHYRYQEQGHHRHRHHSGHRRHKLHRYYWRHRARHHAYFYQSYPYSFVPRHHPHYGGHR